MSVREDIAKLDKYIEQTTFLRVHGFDDSSSVRLYREILTRREKELVNKRNELYRLKKHYQYKADKAGLELTKADIAKLTPEIREIRRNEKICDEILGGADRVLANSEVLAKQSTIENKTHEGKEKQYGSRERSS